MRLLLTSDNKSGGSSLSRPQLATGNKPRKVKPMIRRTTIFLQLFLKFEISSNKKAKNGKKTHSGVGKRNSILQVLVVREETGIVIRGQPERSTT